LQDSLVGQNSQGNFVPHGRHDILHEAIGQPEHPSRVCAAGSWVEIRQFFRVAPWSPPHN